MIRRIASAMVKPPYRGFAQTVFPGWRSSTCFFDSGLSDMISLILIKNISPIHCPVKSAETESVSHALTVLSQADTALVHIVREMPCALAARSHKAKSSLHSLLASACAFIIFPSESATCSRASNACFRACEGASRTRFKRKPIEFRASACCFLARAACSHACEACERAAFNTRSFPGKYPAASYAISEITCSSHALAVASQAFAVSSHASMSGPDGSVTGADPEHPQNTTQTANSSTWVRFALMASSIVNP